MIERIHLEQLQVAAHIGVTAEERATTQRLILNLTLWPDRTQLGDDDIARTVDYAEVAQCAEKFAEKSRYKLIETLAEEIATHVLERFQLRKISVEVRKFVLPNTQYVSVTSIRENAAGDS